MRLVATSLACERNGRQVFGDISFTLERGALLELRGTNGSGKSSLLRMVAGLVPVAGGTLKFEGLDSEVTPATQLHYIAHADATKPALTVRENLAFWCEMLGGTNIAAALAAFALDNLADDEVQLLSAGQKRRLALSRLLVAQRPLWLLDEPATALDQQSQSRLTALIDRHLAEGGMVLAATHAGLGVKSQGIVTMDGAPR